MLLNTFRDNILDRALALLWQQWSFLGVAGYGEIGRNSVVDPEALFLATLRFGRYDQRLFDEVLDWLSVNQKMISIQRLCKIQEALHLCEPRVLAAVSGWVKAYDSTSKWTRLAARSESENPEMESLFLLKSGGPLWNPQKEDPIFLGYGFRRNPVVSRKMSNPFRPGKPNTVLLQFRALFGVNTRAEIILLLLAYESLSIQAIADKSFYSWHAIQSTLQDMAGSGSLIHSGAKRSRSYSLVRESWEPLLGFPLEMVTWFNWAHYFSILTMLWEKLSEKSLQNASAMAQAALIRNWVMEDGRDAFEKAGFSVLVHQVEQAPEGNVLELLWGGLEV